MAGPAGKGRDRAALLLVLLVTLAILAPRWSGIGRVLSGTLGPLTPALLILHALLPLPVTPLILADAALYGPLAAFCWVWPSLVASAAVGYLLGRGLGPLADPLLQRLPFRALRNPSAGLLLLLRLLPWIPLDPVSWWAGAVRVPFGRFLWTTALGILPELLFLLGLIQGGRFFHLW